MVNPRARSVAKWDALKPAYRARLERGGIDREKYLRGDPLSGARGHVTKNGARVPEHGLKDARKNPSKYREYIDKKEPPRIGGGGIKQISDAELLDLIDRAQRNSKRELEDYFKWNEKETFNRIAGEIKYNLDGSIKSRTKGMTVRQLRITAVATAEELRNLGSNQISNNPFYYH